MRWVGKHVIKSEVFVYLVESAVGCESIADHLLHREVHDSRQISVAKTVDLRTALPERRTALMVQPAFAHNVEIWVFILDGFDPRRHTVEVSIGMRIHPDAVNLRIFYPPD